MQHTMCGPVFSYWHFLSNIYEFDLEHSGSSTDLESWNEDLMAKVSYFWFMLY